MWRSTRPTDLLYVADGTSILVFSSASTVNGNASTERHINMGVTIGGLLLDTANNQLYVSDPGTPWWTALTARVARTWSESWAGPSLDLTPNCHSRAGSLWIPPEG